MTASSPDTLTVNVKELLRFFDEKQDAEKGDATGIVSMVGEDLNAACFQHYVESKDGCAAVLDDRVIPGGGYRGPWLDRWIEVQWVDEQKSLYQTEINNWSAHALGGETLKADALPQDVAEYKQRRWEKHWDSGRRPFKDRGITKVLVPMKKPDRCQGLPAKPLLIVWEALGPKEKTNKHLFSITGACDPSFEQPATWPRTKKFDKLWIFSVSSYLRDHLKEKGPKIHLRMPNAARRLRTQSRLLSLDG